MKSIKKFSTEMNQPKSILESIDSKALTELINGMGFKDIHELKKEKALLTKLEALLKEVTPVSEDDAGEIETKMIKKATPKSLESKVGKKEPKPAVGSNNEVAEGEEGEEGEEGDVDDMSVTELTDLVKTIVDQKLDQTEKESDVEEEEELEEESEVTPKATRKIMTFEDFIQEKTDSTKEELEEEELEEEELEEEELEETFTSSHTNGSIVKSFSQFVAESYIVEQSDNGPALKDEKIDYKGAISLPIAKGDGQKSASNIEDNIVSIGEPEKLKDNKELVTNNQEISEDPKTAKDDVNAHGKVVIESTINEKDITSDEQFKEYVEAILKKAFGDDYDEDKAQETVDGLISKYSGDYGAMVGALQSSMGS
jgi:hypothetical protein